MPPCTLVSAASSVSDGAMLATAETDSAKCIEATSISHSRQTTSLISKRKNRAIVESEARSTEKADGSAV